MKDHKTILVISVLKILNILGLLLSIALPIIFYFKNANLAFVISDSPTLSLIIVIVFCWMFGIPAFWSQIKKYNNADYIYDPAFVKGMEGFFNIFIILVALVIPIISLNRNIKFAEFSNYDNLAIFFQFLIFVYIYWTILLKINLMRAVKRENLNN